VYNYEMKTDYPDIPWIEPSFFANRAKVGAEELLLHAGQHIAWSWDGTRILASDSDRRVLDEILRAAGVDPSHVVHDYVDDPEGDSLP
jgi:hypothetical protein